MAPTRWQEIAADLRKRILDGEYPAGAKIPPLRELITKYDVARDTVRDAVRALANEGLVVPLRGVGTVVRDNTPVGLSYAPDTHSRPWNVQVSGGDDVVVDAEWEEAGSEIADRLRLSDRHAQVVHRVRHQSRGETIAQVHEQWIPADIAEGIHTSVGTDLSDTNDVLPTDLYSAIRQAGWNVSAATETFTARAPMADEADLLELPPGVPIIVTFRITHAGDLPVETSTFRGAADRMSYSMTVSLT